MLFRSIEDIWDHVFEAVRGVKPFPVTLEQAVAVMKVIWDARQGTPFELSRRGKLR